MNNFVLSGTIKEMDFSYLPEVQWEPMLRFIVSNDDVCLEVVCVGDYAVKVHGHYNNNESVLVTGELKGFYFEDLNLTAHYCPFLLLYEIKSPEDVTDKKQVCIQQEDTKKGHKKDWIRVLSQKGVSILTEMQYAFLLTYGNRIMQTNFI